jgi:hypothetical protein
MRYFLDEHGTRILRARKDPDDRHVEIAREVLAERRIVTNGPADYYAKMYALKYARVVEHLDQVLEVEFRDALTAGQQRFVEDMARQGWETRFIKR